MAELDDHIAAFQQDMATTPQRFSVVNLDTNEEIVAQLNPTAFEEEVGSEWDRLSTPGQSHQHMQYRYTSNYEVSMDLHFHAYSEAELKEITRARHHLMSWLYPIDHGHGGPPRLLATWPLAFSIECYMTRVRFRNERFLKSGAIAEFTATVTFEESRDRKLTSDQVSLALVVRGEL